MYKSRIKEKFDCIDCNKKVNLRRDTIKDKERKKCNACYLPKHNCELNKCNEIMFLCLSCKKEKQLICFVVNKTRKNGHQKLCKECKKDYDLKSRSNFKEVNRIHDCGLLDCNNKFQYCSYCKMDHNLQFFYKDKNRKGLHSKQCMIVRINRREKKYGLQIGDYQKLMEKQNFKCAVCKKPFDDNVRTLYPCIDHQHLNQDKSGPVRGIVHSICNTLLGLADDNIETLQFAIEYLKSYQL